MSIIGATAPIPAMWNSGAATIVISSSRNSCHPRTMVIDCISRFRWLSIAPLGRPVVPEVYMISAIAVSSTTTGGTAVGSAAASTSS